MRPLPIPRSETEAANQSSQEGFVDEKVVMALVAGVSANRDQGSYSGLVLAADEDFAGWCLETSSFSYASEEAIFPNDDRRAAPPEVEPGIGEPHHGGHRWWIAALAGALCALVFSLMIFSLADQGERQPDGMFILRTPAKPESIQRGDPPNNPELTGEPQRP